MWWKIYKWDGRYIQGEYISKHKTKEKALEKAKISTNYFYDTYEKNDNEERIWLDNKNHIPVGIIIRKTNDI